MINVFEHGGVTALVSEHSTFIYSKDTKDAWEFIQNLKNIIFKLSVSLKKEGTKRYRQKLDFLVDSLSYNL